MLETPMAAYKFKHFVTLDHSNKFDALHDPGSAHHILESTDAKNAGREIAIAKGHALPPESHHSHSLGQGKILWRLIVSHN